MTGPRFVLALVLLLVASAVGVGAAAPSTTPGPASVATPTATDDGTAPLGASVSAFMQASAGQAQGTIEHGLWAAALANASDESAKRALVERRMDDLNGTLDELVAERRALREARRNGSIDAATHRARLSTLVGRLAALGESLEDTRQHGRAVGVNTSRLDTLRSQARTLGGGEVSELARNLTADHEPPGRSDVFGDDVPGKAGGRGPPGADGNGPGAGGAGDRGGGGPPTEGDRGQAGSGAATERTETATPTAA